MQKIFSIFSVLLFCLAAVLYSVSPKVLAADDSYGSKLIITEIRPGGDAITSNGTDFKEYITVFNQSNNDIDDLSGWTVEYAKTTFNPLYCGGMNWENAYTNSPVNVINLSGNIPAGSAVTFNTDNRSINDNVPGSIRLIDDSGSVEDLVGWGEDAPCYETLTEPMVMTAGESLQRLIDCNTGYPVDTDNNSEDFALSDNPGPGVLAGPLTTECSNDSPGGDDTGQNNDNNGSGGQGAGPLSDCDGITISELLPNPVGSDEGKEFIELYNPTNTTVSLAGCKLQTTDSSKMYEFTDEELGPGEYKAFYNGITGLTLTNSTGGSVYLVNHDESEDIDQADYAAGLDDDVSWSLINGEWLQTFSLTPDKSNELLTLKPCPAGQFRNPDTNRCNSLIDEAAGLGPCAPGKKRNPDTNRCRNITSFATALSACASDQYRNPATHRCKKYSSSGALKPCQPGQERNPATNRCRKSMALSDSGVNDVKDVLSTNTQSSGPGWSFAIFSVIGAFSYGIWEWRGEILQKLSLLRTKLS